MWHHALLDGMNGLGLLGLALLILALKFLQGWLQAPPPPQDEPEER